MCVYALLPCVPCLLNQTPQLLSPEFVRRLFKSGDYSIIAFPPGEPGLYQAFYLTKPKSRLCRTCPAVGVITQATVETALVLSGRTCQGCLPQRLGNCTNVSQPPQPLQSLQLSPPGSSQLMSESLKTQRPKRDNHPRNAKRLSQHDIAP